MLAAATPDDTAEGESAPAALKARLYSALVTEQASGGPLRSLPATRDDGGHLCVFEHLVALAPVGDALASRNPCRVCHARVLAERMTRAPIFWPGCPYAEFHRSS